MPLPHDGNPQTMTETDKQRMEVCKKEDHKPVWITIFGWVCGYCGLDLNKPERKEQ